MHAREIRKGVETFLAGAGGKLTMNERELLSELLEHWMTRFLSRVVDGRADEVEGPPMSVREALHYVWRCAGQDQVGAERGHVGSGLDQLIEDEGQVLRVQTGLIRLNYHDDVGASSRRRRSLGAVAVGGSVHLNCGPKLLGRSGHLRVAGGDGQRVDTRTLARGSPDVLDHGSA